MCLCDSLALRGIYSPDQSGFFLSMTIQAYSFFIPANGWEQIG